MSLTAWQQVDRHWPAVIAALREATGPTAGDAWRATCRLRWLVLGLPDPVSEQTAACFKTALGLNRPLGAWLLLDHGAAARPLAEVAPPDRLMDRLDAEGWLVGAHQVCAGPPARIVEAWTALCDPAGTGDLPADALALADEATDLVIALWAVLGATRQVLRDGRLDEAPTWSPAGPVDPGWPIALRLLRSDGPGALVRELPRFEPEWALHVLAEPPDHLAVAVAAVRQALGSDRPLRALGDLWTALPDPPVPRPDGP